MGYSTPRKYHHQPARYATLRRQYHHCPDCLTWMLRDRENDLFLCLQCGRKETREQFAQTVAHNKSVYKKDNVAERMFKKAVDTGHKGVIYYVRFAHLIKIGTTTDLAKRLEVIPWDELLLTEPGSYRLERERHLQFADCNYRNEWFKQDEKLMAFIEQRRGELKELNRATWRGMGEFPWEHGVRIPKRTGVDNETAENLEFLASKYRNRL